MMLSVLCMTLLLSVGLSDGLSCAIINGEPDKNYWTSTTFCSPNEECYIERIKSNFLAYADVYNMGCRSSHECRSLELQYILGKRSTGHVTCFRCCTGDNCNRNYC